MGRKGSRANNNAININVPWDHYSFDLGGNADLQQRLRKRVETSEGFCIFYPKHRQTKGRSSCDDKSNHCNSNLETTEIEETRDPNNTSFETTTEFTTSHSSSDEITHHSDDAMHGKNNRRSSRGKYSVLYPKHHRKKGRNNNGSDDSKEIINWNFRFQGNNSRPFL